MQTVGNLLVGGNREVPTNRPRQKRSRERVQKILYAAADELARTADADALTTTSVSKSSGIPVATIYRYFADRSAIITALIDEETQLINEVVTDRIRQLDTITLETLLDTMIRAHYEAFTQSRRSIVLWFGARASKEVLGRVERRYAYLGAWLIDGSRRAGMVTAEAPTYGGELLAWVVDRGYEFIVREDRDEESIEQILASTVRMLTFAVNEYATELGTTGISQDQFWSAFGAFEPPSGSLKK
jgi:AcrR family transcriptional regulator